ncbi:hypothetical protein IVB45_18620 [Bradyrhizobium sp. 4]|uniref:DUF6680 family protein n=1 Tax=unclassified Bradyrhizobium TaxID=2631580 RepID=UPI001FFC1120|nr:MULTISPECIES: DUF6680 family protein [unclassified Bradyrhizobium]MCK1400136.1 hypothetical protein [Bradyrhizobium sp. 39]MCK1750426.1 hypothetical protein [Bradyrhizobium sp. 135]UPJ32035.1 hypothetical protein IVB45_18620 [Bradyrhizobium sp. 4]
MNIDWAVVFATILGPILAIQAQKMLERSAEKKRRRERIFEALMTNRATRLSDYYVQALNQIDLEFHEKADKPVRDAWRALFGELDHPEQDGAPQPLVAAWIARCNDRLVKLLEEMSKALGRSFSEEEIRRGIYYPKGRFDVEQAQLAVLTGAQRLLDGSSPLKIENAGPGPSEMQLALLKKFHDAYDETGALRVVFSNANEKRNLN